jgi:hypothetical protein
VFALSAALPLAAILVLTVPPLVPCIVVVAFVAFWRCRVNRRLAAEARRIELRRYYP